MIDPLVTVLIDTYNYGQYVEHAIDSVLAQDFPTERTQIIVVDDGSTDDTSDRVKKYGSRLQYLRKDNGGQASAFNFGLAAAKGQIICFLDGDDYWFPDRLRTVMAEFDRHPEAGLVYHPLREFYVDRGEFHDPVFIPISGYVPSDIKNVLLFNGVMTTSSYRRHIIARLLPIPEALRIQADAYLGSLAMFLAPVVAIDRPLGIYRIHGKNLYFKDAEDAESKRLLRRIETRREIVNGMTAWLISHGYDIRRPDIRAAITRWVLLSEQDQFQLTAPGRIRFVRHLLKSFKHQGPLMTPRIRMVNYFNALGSLIVGYERINDLEKAREKIIHWLRNDSPIRSLLPPKNATNPAAISHNERTVR